MNMFASEGNVCSCCPGDLLECELAWLFRTLKYVEIVIFESVLAEANALCTNTVRHIKTLFAIYHCIIYKYGYALSGGLL